MDGLRAHADTGDWQAADRLANLLAQSGDGRLLRFGFNLDGSVADSPGW